MIYGSKTMTVMDIGFCQILYFKKHKTILSKSGMREQFPCISRARVFQYSRCRPVFLDPAFFQDEKGISQIGRQTQVMGDEDDGCAMMTAQPEQGIGHFFLGEAVYGRCRFISQDQPWRDYKGK